MYRVFLVRIETHREKGLIAAIIDATNTSIESYEFGSELTGETGILESLQKTLNRIRTKWSVKIDCVTEISLKPEDKNKVRAKFIVVTE